MLGYDVLHNHIALGGRRGHHERARFDLVGNNAVNYAAIHDSDAADFDDVRAGSLDIRAECIEKVRDIDNMGLFGRIFNGSESFRARCGQHDVDGGADADDIQINRRTHKAFRFQVNAAMVDDHGCPQCLKAFEMLINGPVAKIAATWKGDDRFMESSEQCAHEIIGCAEAMHFFPCRVESGNPAGIHPQRVMSHRFKNSPQGDHDILHTGNVEDVRHILNGTDITDEKGGGQYAQCGILGTADGHFAHQWPLTAYDEFVHEYTCLP